MNEKEILFYGSGVGIQFFGPPTMVARNPIEEPEGIDKPNSATGAPGDRPQDPDAQGKPPGVVSLTSIEVLDALSEGPIEGLVSGQYEYSGIKGQTGYFSASFIPYFPITPGQVGTDNAHQSGFLRSMFYNGTEILDKNGRKNFQNVDVSFTNGTPGGLPLVLESNSNKALETVRSIGERLRGPEIRYKTDASDPLDMELVPGQDELGRDSAKFYKIENRNCTSFRINVKVSALSRTITDPNAASKFEEGQASPSVGRGDTKGTKVVYRIDYRPYFSEESKNTEFSKRVGTSFEFRSWNPVSEEIYGKVAGGYIRQTIIVIDKAKFSLDLQDSSFLGWEIMIYRETFDSYTTSIRNQTVIDSIVEGYEECFAYPNTAFIRHRFRADSFSQVPGRNFRVRMLKVKVPNNYNPILRTYGGNRGGSAVSNGGNADVDGTSAKWNGDWKRNPNGTIKRQWTDNPAWIFYDLLTNKRYGLGRVLAEELVDKWSLFDIATYCDELVSDGYGGVEPRFTADIYINSQADAYQVLNDFASIFRGISIYSGGQVKPISDKPQSPLYTFTNTNVIGGDFSYQSSAKKARHTACMVRFNDKNDNFKPSMSYSEDVEAVQKYGFRIKELSAFGCTSKGQALRLAKWTMISEKLETQTVQFTAGIESAYLSVGDIIQISDSSRGNYDNVLARRRSGRTKRVSIDGNYTTIQLDSSISGFLENGNIGTGENIVFNLLTPPGSVDVVTANLTGSSDSIYIKRSQVQQLLFRKSDVISSGRLDTDAGNQDHTISLITFDHSVLSSYGNRLNTSDYNVTGFTGLLYTSSGAEIGGTGFIEKAPDDFIWAIQYTGKNLNITPDIELYKIISVKELEAFKFSFNAVEYRPEKYAVAESELTFDIPEVIGFPDAATNFFAKVDPLPNTHASKARVSFRHPTNRLNLGGYKAYVKLASAFAGGDYSEDSEGKFPNSEFFYAFINKSNNYFDYLPYANGTYYVRIYSVNNNGGTYSSDSRLDGGFTVSSLNLLLDLEVKSLRMQSDTAPNLSSVKDAQGDFIGVNVPIQWQAGFFKEALKDFRIPSAFTYRITYRKPDKFSNTPNPLILLEKTGIAPNIFLNTLSIAENVGISLPQAYASEVTPIREFDIVIEAVDNNGFTSAGGQIQRSGPTVQVDSLYNNPKGYDIIYVNNAPPPAVHLTDITNVAEPENCLSPVPASLGFCTDQWINEDGQFNFIIKKDDNKLVTSGDTSSICFLLSRSPFSESDIPTKINQIINDSTIGLLAEQIGFNGGVDSLTFSNGFSTRTTVPTPFRVFGEVTALQAQESSDILTEVYMATAFLDHFLAAAISVNATKKNILKKLKFSNVVKVLPRNAFLKDSLLYRAWVFVHINWESPSILMYHGANIDQVELVNYTASYVTQHVERRKWWRGGGKKVTHRTHQVQRRGRKFYFREPMPSRGYDIVILFSSLPTAYGSSVHSAVHTENIPSPLRVIEKTKEHFTVIDNTQGGHNSSLSKGTFFFGVLLGSLIHRPDPSSPFGSQSFNYP